jgi:chemotaxis protein CheX
MIPLFLSENASFGGFSTRLEAGLVHYNIFSKTLMSTADTLHAKYKLAAPPENVLRLAKLVQGAFASNVQEIATIIKADEALAARVIQVATRGRDIDMDIDTAVARIGVHQITLVVLTELLLHAVTKTFVTMLSLGLEARETLGATGDQVVGCIHFKGKANGRVFLRIPCKAAGWIVPRFLGKDLPMEPSELLPDVVGEILNIVGGNFKSNLVDAGLSCSLSVPQVDTRPGFSAGVEDGEFHLSLPLSTEGTGLFLDLIISPIAV